MLAGPRGFYCRVERQNIGSSSAKFPAAIHHRADPAIANGRDEGVTTLLFDDTPEAHGHGKILGGGMVGTHAGDMIGEIALAIEMGADAVDIGKTIHPHPTLGESIGMAAEIPTQWLLGRRRCVHRSARPRRSGAAAQVLRPPALCHEPPSQRGCCPGVPLYQAVRRAQH